MMYTIGSLLLAVNVYFGVAHNDAVNLAVAAMLAVSLVRMDRP